MRAMRVTDVPGVALEPAEVPQPRPGRGELLVQVYAAGITPTELSWYPTTHTKTGEKRSSAIPGHEFSGVIAAVGEDVRDAQPGQEVYGMNDWFSDGAMAEYCVTQPGLIAPKPSSITHIQAASVPIGALTAWQGLFDRAKLQPGERVLVHGGAGGVGVWAVQLANYRGAHVFATVSARNSDVVKRLGAKRVIDYERERFEDVAGQVDVIFDTVGGETLERSWAMLKPGGRMVTVAASGEKSTDERVKRSYFIVEPNRSELIEIEGLLDAGRVQPIVDTVLPLAEAPEAYAGEVKQRRGLGKLVVAVAASAAAGGRKPLQ